jgi:aspartyl-tRNA(Asn)/glutamyl-tRNA(Gln) amidotransferase subunit A
MHGHAWQLDIAGLNAAYARGVHDPESVLQSLLGVIGADTREINAFCHLDAEAALAQAHASAQRWRTGQALGPLDGVPVSIKDLLPVAGWPTRRGSRSTAGDPPATQDAPLVGLLRAAGAVLFGKTTTTEFGWTTESSNPHSGTTRNPRDLSRSAGGSSSGAAAQIAAGWGPLAIGSDAGGSIRLPASWCGIVGFKPTYGAVPAGAQSAFAEFAHFGPMTRSVADCCSAMSVLAQADARDPSSLYPRSAQARSGRLRIGWIEPGADWQPEIAHLYRQLLDQLAESGLQLVQQPREDLAGQDAMWTLWQTRVYESFIDWSDAQRSLLAPGLHAVWEQGAQITPATLARARTTLRALSGRVAEQFAQVDLQLTPATCTTAPLLNPHADAEPGNLFAVNSLSYLFNLTQQPALSLPLGQDAKGLPFNLQIVGRRYADDLVLDFGRRIETLVATMSA